MTAPDATLRAFLARILGYERTDAIEHALRSIALYVMGRAALVLLGETDLVPIAVALHRLTVGADRPFVVCDPRRAGGRATVRSPPSCAAGVAAVEVARGGSLCLRHRRPPRDLSSMTALVRDPAAAVRIVICAEALHARDPFLILPAPIVIPPLRARASEVPQIIDDYGADAIEALGANLAGFHEADRRWVLERAAGSLSEIHTASMRLVALRASGTIEAAAARLGMSGAALRHWIGRRRGAL